MCFKDTLITSPRANTNVEVGGKRYIVSSQELISEVVKLHKNKQNENGI